MGVWEEAAVVLAGRYRLDELIGRGGTGEVWRGYDLRPGWPVAVKILAPQVADAAVRERFAREARTAARIVHPNVVTVLDMGEHEGRPYLVMELLTGRDLAAELAERGPLSVAETCRLAGQIALGLDAAHQAGVVHRDVKPANLHLGAGGALKVVDFGTARVATEAAMRLTSVGTVIGTAAYLSPEQIRGEAGAAAADLYALGCVCYELLCGRPPFVGTATEVISQHVGARPDPPGRYRPGIPAELERLILALLEKDPAARPTGGEVVRGLLAAAPRRTPHASGPPAPTSVLPSVPPVPAGKDGSPVQAWAGRATRFLRESPPGMFVAILLGVVALPVLVALWASASPDPAGQGTAAVPPAITSAAPPERSTPASPTPAVSRSASAAPSPAPSRTAPAAGGWQARLAALGQAVTAQELQGKIDPKTARKVRERIVKLAGKLQEGDNRKARDELRKLGRELSEAQRKGRIASEGPLVDFLRTSGLTFQVEGQDSGPRHRSSDDDDDD
ncbi:protein kinase [Streptosporangium sp. NPDC001681]|uniref:serine/threonine-protein kinase n=1 Tax=Streptosporangium sp. NPDC001681 TaxID=3154395 RepID=UPI0033334501